MISQEWALIAFTILAQLSVGSFLVLGAVHTVARAKMGEKQADRLADIALLAIGPALVLGLAASLLHLGSPMSAYGAINNLASSWLSREILFGVLFAASGGLFALLQARKIGPFGLRRIVAFTAAVIGMALVYSMAQVYMLPSQPAWNSWATPASFVTTSALLGALAMGSALMASYYLVRRKDPACQGAQCELVRSTLKSIALLSIVLLGVEFVVVPLGLAQTAASSGAGAESVAMLVGQYGGILAIRLALVFLGAGVIALFLYQSAQARREGTMATLAYSAFGLVFASEVIGRFLFYATHVRIGI